MASHSGAEAVERDHTRDATIAQFGTPPLRFSQNHAIRETAWVVETIRRVWLRGSAETPDAPEDDSPNRRVALELRIRGGNADPGSGAGQPAKVCCSAPDPAS